MYLLVHLFRSLSTFSSFWPAGGLHSWLKQGATQSQIPFGTDSENPIFVLF